jgi:hypothetical protein
MKAGAAGARSSVAGTRSPWRPGRRADRSDEEGTQGRSHSRGTTPPDRATDRTPRRGRGSLHLWVPRNHPPSSGDHPVLVDEVGQTIGSS